MLPATTVRRVGTENIMADNGLAPRLEGLRIFK